MVYKELMAGGIIPLKVLYTQQQKEREGPRALDCSPDSWHMSRCCIGLWLKRYFYFLALVAMLFSQAEPSDQFI